MHHLASLKKGFVKLLKSRPNVVNYIRKLAYNGKCNDDDHLLSPILSNFLPSISRLNCLAIKALDHSWDTLDSSLSSAFLHLMRLPTINHIDLSHISHISEISHCLVSLYLSICFDSIYRIWRVLRISIAMERMVLLKMSSRRRCP